MNYWPENIVYKYCCAPVMTFTRKIKMGSNVYYQEVENVWVNGILSKANAPQNNGTIY